MVYTKEERYIMTKTVCDICGEEMVTPKLILNFCISVDGKRWDVCDKCREDLARWMAVRRSEREDKNG